jgi:hypothetical protein
MPRVYSGFVRHAVQVVFVRTRSGARRCHVGADGPATLGHHLWPSTRSHLSRTILFRLRSWSLLHTETQLHNFSPFFSVLIRCEIYHGAQGIHGVSRRLGGARFWVRMEHFFVRVKLGRSDGTHQNPRLRQSPVQSLPLLCRAWTGKCRGWGSSA